MMSSYLWVGFMRFSFDPVNDRFVQEFYIPL